MEEVPFQVEVTHHERQLQALVFGELDFANASKLDAILQSELQDTDAELVLDFHGVVFLDSEGMKSIVRAYRRIHEAGGRISVIGCNDVVKRLFDILGLREVLGVKD